MKTMSTKSAMKVSSSLGQDASLQKGGVMGEKTLFGLKVWMLDCV